MLAVLAPGPRLSTTSRSPRPLKSQRERSSAATPAISLLIASGVLLLLSLPPQAYALKLSASAQPNTIPVRRRESRAFVTFQFPSYRQPEQLACHSSCHPQPCSRA